MDTSNLEMMLEELMPCQYREFLDWREMWLLSTNLYRSTQEPSVVMAPISMQNRDSLMGIIESCKRAMLTILGKPVLLVYRYGADGDTTLAELLAVIERWNPDTEAGKIYPPQVNHSGTGDVKRFRSGQ